MNNEKKKKVWDIFIKPKYYKTSERVLNLKNFKSIKKTSLKIENLSILIGENSAGKSNILKYIYIYGFKYFDLGDIVEKLSQEFAGHALGAIAGYRSNETILVFKPLGITLSNFKIVLDEKNEIFSFSSGVKETKKLPIENTLMVGKSAGNGNELNNIKNYFKKEMPEGFKDNSINSFEDGIPFYPIYIDLSNMYQQNVEHIISQTLFSILEIGFNLFRSEDDIYTIMSFIPEIKNNINKVLLESIELKKQDKTISVYLNLDYQINEDEVISAKNFQILIKDEAEKKVFPPNLRSSGVNNIITITIITEFLKYLIINFPDSNYCNLNYLFLIDEPELYLHPKIQKKLIEYIYTVAHEVNEIHFLLTTHSPYIVHPNALSSTYIVDYNEENGTVARKLIDIVNKKEDAFNIMSPIEDALGLTFNEFLHPIIFVEGEEEFDLFKRISEIYKYTCSLHSLGGKNKFASIAILLNKFKSKNKKFTIFLDADFSFKDDFKSVENGNKLLEELSEHIFFIGKKIYDFESYKVLAKKDECLEDYIIYHIFKDKEYQILRDVFNDTWKKYFKIESKLIEKINLFSNVVERIRGFIKNNTIEGKIKKEVLEDKSMSTMNSKKVCLHIETEIKEKIKEKLINDNDKFILFEKEIKRKIVK